MLFEVPVMDTVEPEAVIEPPAILRLPAFNAGKIDIAKVTPIPMKKLRITVSGNTINGGIGLILNVWYIHNKNAGTKKTDTNTEWLIRQLARFAGVEAKNIGYAGLKDRNAVTYQWLSVNLEGIEEPDWEMFDVSGCEIIKKTYHRKKLKRGSIKHNQFHIVLRELDVKYYDDISKKVEQIKHTGVPNYFAQHAYRK